MRYIWIVLCAVTLGLTIGNAPAQAASCYYHRHHHHHWHHHGIGHKGVRSWF